MIAIQNAKVVLEHGILWDGVILIQDDRIIEVGQCGQVEIPSGAQIIDAKGKYVGPGFVDIHVHRGNDLESFENPLGCAEFFLQYGTTTFLPTSKLAFDLETSLEGFRNIRKAMEKGGAGRCIAGVYMEGPFMNPKYGCSPEANKWRAEISPEQFIPLVDGAGDLVKVWAIAPERKGILPFVQYAKKVNPNVRFALGHSEANFDQARALKPYGLNILTHCMDATGQLSDMRGTRGNGPDEYCFMDQDMYAELISDSHAMHVSAPLQRLILKNKGLERVILITDSNMKENNASPERLKHITDLAFDIHGDLAGSRLTMDQVCRNIMTHTSCGIAQAFLMASTNPANAIGMGYEIGSVAKGKKANLVFVDDTFCVDRVMLEGEMQSF